jgi:hypothetical protein
MSLVTRIALLCFPASYRPERYFMRGPGPMWHAKHNPSVVGAARPQRRDDRPPMENSRVPQ